MVEMSSSFTLPPMIRRFGRCGEWEQRMPSSSSSEVGESSRPRGESYINENTHHSCYGGSETGTERVKSFVNGIVSPFTACWQPSEGYCVPGCGPDHVFQKKPAVVSPRLDRAISYRDSRFEHEQDEYSRHAHQRHRTSNNYNPPRHLSKSSPITTFPSRREPAAVEADVASDSSLTATAATACDKRTRSTDIAKPHSNDILCGRGGSSNRHLGNIHFRELVAANKQVYVGLTKKQKMLVARKIVDVIHNTGGRFLAKDLDTGLFYDIGLPRSLEKTSQALREKHSNEMPVQPAEGEGIETSVESHNSVLNKGISTDGNNHAVVDSPVEPPSKSTQKSSKNTEAPSLIIPSHLLKKFGQNEASPYDEDSENYHQHALSPRGHYNSEVSYDNYRSPYPPSPYRIPPGSSPPHHNRNGYQTVAGHQPAQSSINHHHHLSYPASPVSGNNQYRPHPHYYYHRHPPRTPPYVRRGRRHDERYSYHPHDDREVYSNEYYSRSNDFEKAPLNRPPHGRPPPAQYHRLPGHYPSTRHYGHTAPQTPTHSPSQGDSPPPPPRSTFGPHASPTLMPPYRPVQKSPQNHYRYEKDGSSNTVPHETTPSSRIMYRATNSGYVRSNSEVSPSRQRELKRQRNVDGRTNRTSDASLSSAVKYSLSLDERVVGRERGKQNQQLQGSKTAGDQSRRSSSSELISPSSLLQSTSSSRRSMARESGRGSPTEKKEDYSTLSGLAALSTAAFLKLDEDEDKDKK